MDARRWLWGVVLVVAGCSQPQPSGEVLDAKKAQEAGQYLPSEPAKQDEGIKGIKGFNRATPPLSVKKPENPDDLKPLNFRPVTYFAKNCASCHGTDGAKFTDAQRASALEKDFGAKLATEVRDKAKTKVTGRELAAVAMLTQSVLRGAAYVAWIEKSTYEVRPGSKVVIRGTGQEKKKSDTDWSVSGLKDGSELLVTKEGAAEASLVYPRSQAHGPFTRTR